MGFKGVVGSRGGGGQEGGSSKGVVGSTSRSTHEIHMD